MSDYHLNVLIIFYIIESRILLRLFEILPWGTKIHFFASLAGARDFLKKISYSLNDRPVSVWELKRLNLLSSAKNRHLFYVFINQSF